MKPKKEKKADITGKKKESARNRYGTVPGREKIPAQGGGATAATAVVVADPGAIYTAPKKEKEAAAPVKAAPETAELPIYQRDTYTPAEAYAPGLQEEPEELLWKQGKQLPVEKTPLYTALERVRSGKSLKPTLEEVYTAVALPIYQRDTYTPPAAYAAGGQKVELPGAESGYKRGGLASLTRVETDPVEADRREAGALGARLRLGEATDREFDEYLDKIESCYGYIPAIGSREEILEEIQSYLRSWQPKAETFAEQRAEGRDPLSRIRNIMAGAAKQYAGSIGSAASTLYQANYENAARYLNEGGEDPELGGMVDPAEYARRVTERSRSVTEGMNGWADGLTQRGAEDIARAQEGLNPAGRMLVNAGVGAVQMAGDAAVAFATGGSAKLPMMVRAFGAGAQEARAKGYSEEQQVLLGLTGAATEYLSERLFGGNPVYDSDVGLVNRLVGKIVKNPTVMEVLTSAPVKTLNEGLEGVVSSLLDPVAEWAVTGNRPEYELDRIIEDGATEMLTALMANGGAKVVNAIAGGRKAAAGTEVTQEKAEPIEKSRYTIRRDATGDTYVQIDADILEGKPKDQWGKTIRQEIQRIFSEGIKLKRGTILTNRKGRGEYTNGTYTKMIERVDPQMYQDKMRMAVGSDGIVESATDVAYEGAGHARKDDIVGFNRGKIVVSVRGAGYKGDVLTAVYSDGKETFFDINNLERKKIETASPERYAGQTDFTQTGDTVSDIMIPQGGGDVKGRSIPSDDPLIREIRRLFGKDGITGERED